MKKAFYPAVLLIVIFLATSLVSGQTKETRNVKDFSKVSFGVAGELYIKIGPEYHLTIEGSKRAVDETETVVSGDRLTIKRDNWRFSFNNDDKVIINLTLPELEGVGVSGSGKAQIMDQLEADDLNLSVSGSGKIMTANLSADNFHCGISGSGNVILGSGGSIDSGSISISGSGSFSGEEVEIDHLEVSISGSGNCHCKAGDSLEAHVSGSGDVTYLGNPKVNARVSGSGHVRSR